MSDESHPRSEYTNADLRAAFLRARERIDGPLKPSDYARLRRDDDPHHQTIIKRFGKWTTARERFLGDESDD